MTSETYTAILWGFNEDSNSTPPLEVSGDDYDLWMDKAECYTERFHSLIENYTGLYIHIFKGDANADSIIMDNDEMVEYAYIDPDWSDERIKSIAARLAGVEPEQIVLKRLS